MDSIALDSPEMDSMDSARLLHHSPGTQFHPPAPQPPTPGPQTIAGSSRSEVARTVSANKCPWVQALLTSMESARLLLYELFRLAHSGRAWHGQSSSGKPATYNKGFAAWNW